MSVAVPSTAGPAATPARNVAVRVADVHKTFRIPQQRYNTLKERALHPFRSAKYTDLRAVNGVSLEVPAGEFFGIVGRNGSGKSTLLKCMAGIYDVDSGTIDLDGRLSPFIELGVGFNADLTARENVLINAVMLGMSRREARRRFDQIIDFAELHDFVDLPVKNYSSGMSVRLAFSTAIQVEADILLIDEVLAVGDAAFQQKCFDQFEKMRREARTIVLVTHDMSAVERFCHRALLLEHGTVTRLGDPHEVALAYNELNFGRLPQVEQEEGRYGDHQAAEIQASWFEDVEGERITSAPQGADVVACMQVRLASELEDPIFGFTLRNDVKHTVFVANSLRTHPDGTGRFAAGDEVTVRLRFPNWLSPTRYTTSPSVARSGSGADLIDLREDLATLVVHGQSPPGALVDLPHTLEIAR